VTIVIFASWICIVGYQAHNLVMFYQICHKPTHYIISLYKICHASRTIVTFYKIRHEIRSNQHVPTYPDSCVTVVVLGQEHEAMVGHQ
jgi:hypothetical protein